MSASRIVLCADDFGLSPGVNRGIVELLEKGRLSAASCMVNYPEFARDATLLQPFAGRADMGLHFSLTESRSIASVAIECHLKPPPPAAMRDEVERQLRKFADAVGRLPDYIDGHQHVHVLPVVREAVVGAAARIGAYVRSTREPIGIAMWRRPSAPESFYLSRASRALDRLAHAAGVETNRGFRGVRTFRETAPFGELFRKMVADAREGTLVICHPGHPDDVLARRDPVCATRADEWNYLSGPDFPADLARAGLALARLRDIDPTARPPGRGRL
ncbi:MAG: ChbG/HpnK family deacetylase [Rhizomicrobium sp.]